jgi:hypothetical protein
MDELPERLAFAYDLTIERGPMTASILDQRVRAAQLCAPAA